MFIVLRDKENVGFGGFWLILDSSLVFIFSKLCLKGLAVLLAFWSEVNLFNQGKQGKLGVQFSSFYFPEHSASNTSDFLFLGEVTNLFLHV